MVTNKQIKVAMLQDILQDIMQRKSKHYSKYSTLKKWSGFLKAAITGTNAVSVCSLVLSLSPDSQGVIIALVTTSTSAIISAVITAYELETKIHSHKTSYLQYQDVHRDMCARLYRNGLTSADLDGMLAEMNARIGLVDDNSLPVSPRSPGVTDIPSLPTPISQRRTMSLKVVTVPMNDVLECREDDPLARHGPIAPTHASPSYVARVRDSG